MNKIYGPNEVNISVVNAGGTDGGLIEASNVVHKLYTTAAAAAAIQVPVPVSGENRQFHAEGIKSVSVYMDVSAVALGAAATITLYKVVHSGTATPVATAVTATSAYYNAGVSDATLTEAGFWELIVTPTIPEVATTNASYHVEIATTGGAGSVLKIYGVKVEG